jgi:phosphoribosyl 1,2-cyclic phosphodiesterase
VRPAGVPALRSTLGKSREHMQLTFRGVRGSIPSPGAGTARYGGNTSCLEIRTADGSVLVLDAGTGIRALGEALTREGEPSVFVDVLITHAHWDHVQGLPFFAPLYRRGSTIRIWGAGGATEAVHRVVRDQMSPSTFPVSFASLPSRVRLEELSGARELGGVRVEHLPASHQGGAVGYRLTAGNGRGGALVYLPDNEISAPQAHGLDSGWRDWFGRFIGGADLLVHDAMYTEAEYPAHIGWGHSHMTEVVRAARDAGVRRLALFHHHPSRMDDALERSLEQCRRDAGPTGGMEVFLAAEGATLTL